MARDPDPEGSRIGDLQPVNSKPIYRVVPPKNVCGRGSLLGVAQPQRVEGAPTPGRRVFPSAIAATMSGVDERASSNPECDAPLILGARVP